MQLENLKLTNLRNEEHFQFNTEFNGLVIRFTPAALGIEEKYAIYLPVYNKESEALDVVRKSDKTDNISDADDIRDGTNSGLHLMVEAHTYHWDDKKREAAQRIMIVLDRFGNINKKGYAAETAAINNMWTELTTSYSDDVALLKLSGWLDELKSNNEAFEALTQERYADEATKTKLKMKEVRKVLDDAYRNITRRVNALVVVNGAEAYAPFINELNQRIEKYNLIIAQRKGRNNKQDED